MNGLSSFPEPVHAVLIGHSGGVGGGLLRALLDNSGVAHVTAGARRLVDLDHDKLQQVPIDISAESSVANFAIQVQKYGPPRLIIIATGLLHDGADHQPEKSWRGLNSAQLQRSFNVNVIGPALLAKHLLPLLPRKGKSVFAALSARVSSISDNRLGGWYGYRASKAALNMIIKNLSLELVHRWPEAICVGLHPGTVNTLLSQPFQGNVAKDKLFSPGQSAEYLLSVIDDLTPEKSGALIAWDGAIIPF